MNLNQQREQLEKELLKACLSGDLEAARTAKRELEVVYEKMNLKG